ncbi:MAG: DUF1080 domain-containing protein [Calditrichaeota bacterium]|nr:DUF1080 domain-containing protein [Calditrichota bacterium]
MLKQSGRFLIIAVIFTMMGCATTQRQQAVTQESLVNVPLQDLLSQLPAHNAVEQTLLMQAIIGYNSDGVQKIAAQLASKDSTERIAANYALNGLSHFVTRGGREMQRRMFVAGVEQSLLTQLPVLEKAFLISQLRNCAKDDQIPTLSQFLNHERLCDPAARALVTIGSPAAAKALFAALPGATDGNQITIIKSLGELRYLPAADKIMEYAGDAKSAARETALFSLANMPYLAAENLIKEAAIGDKAMETTYLRYIRRLFESGNASRGVSLCQNIFQDKFSKSAKIAALTLLVDGTGSQAINDVLSFMQDDDKKVRVAALRLAEKFDTPEITQKWTGLIKTSEPETKAEIIEMFGRRGSAAALPVVKASLQSGNARVRLAAFSAEKAILGEKAAADLIAALPGFEEADLPIVKRELSTLPTQALLPVIENKFDNLDGKSKIILLEILQERHAGEALPFLRESLKSDDAELRIAALKGLADLGQKDDLAVVLRHWQKCENASEKKEAQNAITAIIRNSSDQKAAFNQLGETFSTLSTANKIAMLKIYRNFGGDKAFQFVQKQSENKALNEAATRTIIDWPDESALDAVVQIAQNNKNQTLRILAIRGALRILRENPMGAPSAFAYCRQLMQAADRPEEKRMVLAGLSNIKSPQSLRYVARLTQDKSIAYEAAFAAAKIASADTKSEENLSADQVALAFIEANADKKLLQKLQSNPIIEEKQNKPPRKFAALFNGKDLTGWKGLVANPPKRAQMSAEELAKAQVKADQNMRDHWKVVDGVLCFDGKGQSLCTAKDYQNFELYVDWKIEKHGDSGIYLRGSPQVQIWDTAQWPEGSGGLYNNKINPSKPLVRADHPVGQWNTFHIIMRGDKVTVYLNDVLVVDNVVMENYWERDKPIYPVGQIELQSHHTPLYFRNIFIRELPKQEPRFSGYLFNGKDKTGWKVIGNSPDSWKVEDGILYTSGGGGGWISTTRQFADFRLELEFRVPPGGNSGVFLRTPRKGNPAYVGMEIQVLDDYAKEYEHLHPWQYTGSIYGVQAPSMRVTKKANEWQKEIIECKGPHVKVTLNGKEIINANLIDYMDKASTHPGLKRRKGYIGLQTHTSRVDFRNIKLTEF